MTTKHQQLSPRVRGEQASPALFGRNLSEMPDCTGERRGTLLRSGGDDVPAGLPMFRRRPARVRALLDLLHDLPDTLTRREAAETFPGLVTVSSLRSADARGAGPRRREYSERGVLYPLEFLLEWIEERYL